MPRPAAFELSDPPVLGNPNFAALAQAFLGDLPVFADFLEAYADWIEAGQYAELAAAGTIKWTGDADTYINHPGADQIAAWVNGVRRLLLTAAALQIDVPITGSAVQSSPTDATAGRLMPVGAFGLGAGSGGVTFVSNLDDVNTPAGFYAVNTSSTGTRPPGGSSFAFLLILRQSSTGIMQLWVNSNGLVVAYRISTGGTWDPWARIYDQRSILGTVSQASGVPTGAVMEGNASAASPSGGYFKKLANGFQNLFNVLTTSTGGDTTLTFTSAFLSGSAPVVSITPQSDSDLRPRVVSVSPTAVVFSIRDAAGARVAVPAHINISGRWSNMA